MPTHLLFLDRDGTLNRTLDARPPNTPDEVELLPRAREVLERQVAQGWQLIVVTNQGGVASGYISERQAREVQATVLARLGVPIAADYLCPHMPAAAVPEYSLDCPNRKPKPGFILAALQQFHAKPEDCLFVGDSITDRQAAQAAGMPFQWADLFFGRKISRGLYTADGQWLQIRQTDAQEISALPKSSLSLPELRTQQGALGSGVPQEREDLYLLALIRSKIVGWLTILPAGSRGNRGDAYLDLWVSPSDQGMGIGDLMMQVGMEWSSRQRDLQRLCVQVPDLTVPVARLCCKFGFSEQKTSEGQQVADQVTLVCDR